MEQVICSNMEEWVLWMKENHDQKHEVWLVYHKKSSAKPSVSYEESVEVALCYGWIDSIIRGIDDQMYMRKFTPRKEKSVWSESNRKRIEKLIRENRMTPKGMHLVHVAKENGMWDQVVVKPEISEEIHHEFGQALDRNPVAKEHFNRMPQSCRKDFIQWINHAKREETRQRRIKESIDLLVNNMKLGLK